MSYNNTVENIIRILREYTFQQILELELILEDDNLYDEFLEDWR